MKITVISPFSFGYIDALVEKLATKSNVVVTFINLKEIDFKYTSFIQRMKNFFSKTLLNKNLKKEFQAKKIREVLDKKPEQDIILVIRPDKLNTSLLPYLKSRAGKLISYYFDAIQSIPEKLALIPFFDEVYSFEKNDVDRYKLKFIPNFIPIDDFKSNKKCNGVFNISSYDGRWVLIEKIAVQLQQYNYPYNFIIRKEKPFHSNILLIIPEYLPLKEVKKHIEAASILLDIQKENQKGLSFRVFEALGYDKKLITTNKDVKTYDFYNYENILIIDKNNPIVPKDFLVKSHNPVPEAVKIKYRRDEWIKKVFKI